MSIKRLHLKDFTAFRSAEFEFAAGVNVFIGANATGKTHVMKALYATLKATEDKLSASGLDVRLKEKLARVFRPDDMNIGRLGHRVGAGHRSATVRVVDDDKREVAFTVYTRNAQLKVTKSSMREPPAPIFLPSREALAMYEGFIAAYQARELSFDETYFDLAVALSAAAVRGAKPPVITEVLKELESALGGKVSLTGDRFYVGTLEAHLVSEGMRKLASVVRLLTNNELRQRGVLFWDEPEANLNPQLSVIVARVLQRLASEGIQVFVATHDYLVAESLGLLAAEADAPPMRFFSFTRAPGHEAVEVEGASDLDDLERNLIREEFLRHYDRVRGAG
ncbi:MAG: AAA family ATPase [Sandaracinaceae bacterium]|nr:AAA family ATPase [Sandaracinaceae bacterium]